ncbi:MAG TPA: DUF4824 family protein, partial [Vicinamibacterales bacterium]|jgi:hypothetical protein|nr:DUF4824 family protein [Vicinamibacterales bacterium]
VALEYDGLAWQAIAAHYRRERDDIREQVTNGGADPTSRAKYLDNLLQYGTRLVLIDASLDAAALRRARPNANVIILPAVARAWLTRDTGEPGAPPTMTGTVTPLTTTMVAPPRDRALLLAKPTDVYGHLGPPRYRVDLHVGRRHEPWIQDAVSIDSSESPH